MGKLPCEAAREAVVTHTHLGGEPPELASVLGSWDILQGPCRGFPFGLQMGPFPAVSSEHHPWVLVSVVAPFLKIMLSFILNRGSLC